METIPSAEPLQEIQPEPIPEQDTSGKKSKKGKTSANKGQKKTSKKKSKEDMHIENQDQPNIENPESPDLTNKENHPGQTQDKNQAPSTPSVNQKEVKFVFI
jgi:hypothetical protein